MIDELILQAIPLLKWTRKHKDLLIVLSATTGNEESRLYKWESTCTPIQEPYYSFVIKTIDGSIVEGFGGKEGSDAWDIYSRIDLSMVAKSHEQKTEFYEHLDNFIKTNKK